MSVRKPHKETKTTPSSMVGTSFSMGSCEVVVLGAPNRIEVLVVRADCLQFFFELELNPGRVYFHHLNAFVRKLHIIPGDGKGPSTQTSH